MIHFRLQYKMSDRQSDGWVTIKRDAWAYYMLCFDDYGWWKLRLTSQFGQCLCCRSAFHIDQIFLWLLFAIMINELDTRHCWLYFYIFSEWHTTDIIYGKEIHLWQMMVIIMSDWLCGCWIWMFETRWRQFWNVKWNFCFDDGKRLCIDFGLWNFGGKLLSDIYAVHVHSNFLFFLWHFKLVFLLGAASQVWSMWDSPLN